MNWPLSSAGQGLNGRLAIVITLVVSLLSHGVPAAPAPASPDPLQRVFTGIPNQLALPPNFPDDAPSTAEKDLHHSHRSDNTNDGKDEAHSPIREEDFSQKTPPTPTTQRDAVFSRE